MLIIVRNRKALDFMCLPMAIYLWVFVADHFIEVLDILPVVVHDLPEIPQVYEYINLFDIFDYVVLGDLEFLLKLFEPVFLLLDLQGEPFPMFFLFPNLAFILHCNLQNSSLFLLLNIFHYLSIFGIYLEPLYSQFPYLICQDSQNLFTLLQIFLGLGDHFAVFVLCFQRNQPFSFLVELNGTVLAVYVATTIILYFKFTIFILVIDAFE